MTEPGDDFETFLKTRTVLPNGMSDDDKLEPPKALDAIVLNKAREAIRARQQPNRTARWATPVALAATILLCLSIVLNVSLNTNRPAANLQRVTAATANSASPAPASPISEGERRENVAGGASDEAILPEAKVVEPRAPRPPVIAETAAPAPDESLRPDASAAAKTDALASGRRMQALREAATTTDSAADKAAQLAASTGMAMQGPVEAASAAKSVEAKRAAQPADHSRTSGQGPSGAASAADAPAQLADQTRTPGAGETEAQSTANSPVGGVDMLAARGFAGTAAGRAPVTPTREPTAAPSAAAPPPHPQDPKTWLQQIAALRAEGKTAQADAEMQRFRAIFPAYEAKPGPTAPSEPSK
jgi:hypothetical protein